MVRLVKKHDLGLIAEDFTAESMANALLRMTADEIQQFKHYANKAAKELSFDSKEPEFLETIQRLMIRN